MMITYIKQIDTMHYTLISVETKVLYKRYKVVYGAIAIESRFLGRTCS